MSPGQPRRWPLPRLAPSRAHKSARATAFHSSLPSQDIAIPADYTASARGKLHLPLPGREAPQGKRIDKKKNEISFVHVANLLLFLLRPSAVAGESISSAINLLGSSAALALAPDPPWVVLQEKSSFHRYASPAQEPSAAGPTQHQFLSRFW